MNSAKRYRAGVASLGSVCAMAAFLFSTNNWVMADNGDAKPTAVSPQSVSSQWEKPVDAEPATKPTARKPSGRATADLVPLSMDPVIDIKDAWASPLGGPRGGGCSHDNGLPLEDFGDPASQLSQGDLGASGTWQFVAAAADDFMFEDIVTPDVNCKITHIRAAFMFFGEGSENADPTTMWQSIIPPVAGTGGIYVTIYENSPILHTPTAEPTMDGSHSGPVIAHRFISTDDLIAAGGITGPSGTCRSIWTIDIDLTLAGQEIVVAKNRTFWLSLVPRFPAPPQSGWCISESVGYGYPAVQGASFGIPFWDVILGNSDECAGAPAEGTHKDLSFVITAEEIPTTTGACCNTATSVCVDVFNPGHCGGGPDEVFHPGTLCEWLDPPCNEGACCYPDGFGGGLCIVTDSADCISIGGFKFEAGSPCPINCAPPPPNDECDDSQILVGTGVTIPFDTTGATTPEGAPTTICGDIAQDIWFDYQVPCTGNVVISTDGSTFDTILAVYGPGFGTCPDATLCPVTDDSETDCNDDWIDIDPDNTLSLLIVPASVGQCLKIRVGGKDLGPDISGGPGVLHIDCIPPGTGSCCHADRTCDDFTLAATCDEDIGDVFTDGAVCSDITCPPAPDNDECVDTTHLSNNNVSLAFDTRFATTNPSSPTTVCGDVVQDVWFSYVAPCTGTVVINTLGSAFDTFIAVYNFSGGMSCPDTMLCPNLGLLEIDCNDDWENELISNLSITVTSGDCLIIRVGGKDLGVGASGGSGLLNIDCVPTGLGACCHLDRSCTDLQDEVSCDALGGTFIENGVCSALTCPPAPANDLCDAAIPLAGVAVEQEFDTDTATTGTDAAITLCGSIVQDIWFSYDVPCTGTVVIRTEGSSYDTRLAVYGPSIGMGCPDTDLCPPVSPAGDNTELDCHDDLSEEILTSEVIVSATTGDCLLIRVGGEDVGLGISGGPGILKINCVESGLGACCHVDRTCEDNKTLAECMALGDVYSLGNVCSDNTCPPPPDNDACGDTELLAGDSITHLFDTTYATTAVDAPLTMCGDVVQDVWFGYEATCDGRIVVTTEGSTFDTILAVYGPSTGAGCPDLTLCPAPSPGGDNTEAICDDDTTGTTSYLAIESVSVGECFLIRVGGKDVGLGLSGGDGILTVDCIPAGMGACCRFTGGCEQTIEVDCDLPGDQWFEGEPCLASTCREVNPLPRCCLGDMNDDGLVNGLDMPLFMAAVFSPPTPSSYDFCHADTNQDDSVDAADVERFMELLLEGEACAMVCCPGDLDGSGILDAPDRPLLEDAIATPPAEGTLEFCRADVNTDGVVDGDDLTVFDSWLGIPCEPLPTCCVGDLNDDGLLNGVDVQLMIDVLAAPPLPGSEACCRADANADAVVDIGDVPDFVNLILNGGPCP